MKKPVHLPNAKTGSNTDLVIYVIATVVVSGFFLYTMGEATDGIPLHDSEYLLSVGDYNKIDAINNYGLMFLGVIFLAMLVLTVWNMAKSKARAAVALILAATCFSAGAALHMYGTAVLHPEDTTATKYSTKVPDSLKQKLAEDSLHPDQDGNYILYRGGIMTEVEYRDGQYRVSN